MDTLHRGCSLRIKVPCEKRTKVKVLNDGKLGQDFGVEHFDHALVDLAPSVTDAGDVEQDGTVLPEGALLHIVDEADGGEVHVCLALSFDDGGFGDVAGFGGASD